MWFLFISDSDDKAYIPLQILSADGRAGPPKVVQEGLADRIFGGKLLLNVQQFCFGFHFLGFKSPTITKKYIYEFYMETATFKCIKFYFSEDETLRK